MHSPHYLEKQLENDAKRAHITAIIVEFDEIYANLELSTQNAPCGCIPPIICKVVDILMQKEPKKPPVNDYNCRKVGKCRIYRQIFDAA